VIEGVLHASGGFGSIGDRDHHRRRALLTAISNLLLSRRPSFARRRDWPDLVATYSSFGSIRYHGRFSIFRQIDCVK
jgi:hypothetical protein